jgi:hypothetical protein
VVRPNRVDYGRYVRYHAGREQPFPAIIAVKVSIGLIALILFGLLLVLTRRIPPDWILPCGVVLAVAVLFLLVLSNGATCLWSFCFRFCRHQLCDGAILQNTATQHPRGINYFGSDKKSNPPLIELPERSGTIFIAPNEFSWRSIGTVLPCGKPHP